MILVKRCEMPNGGPMVLYLEGTPEEALESGLLGHGELPSAIGRDATHVTSYVDERGALRGLMVERFPDRWVHMTLTHPLIMKRGWRFRRWVRDTLAVPERGG